MPNEGAGESLQSDVEVGGMLTASPAALKGRPAEVKLVHMAPSNVKTKNMATQVLLEDCHA